MSAYEELVRSKTKRGGDLAVTRFNATEANMVGISLTLGQTGLHIRVGIVDGRPEVTIADRDYATRHRITATPDVLMITPNVAI